MHTLSVAFLKCNFIKTKQIYTKTSVIDKYFKDMQEIVYFV